MTWTAQSPCATCGTCCRSYVVPLLGQDVWRISRGLGLSPELFVLAYDQPEPGPDGFLLEHHGRPQGLALDKRGDFDPASPCVFLVELGGGHARCGIYELRPGTCRTYPMARRDATVALRQDALCPPGAWSTRQVATPHWRLHLQDYTEQWEAYVAVVQGWNDRISRHERRATLPEYLGFLLNVYDRPNMRHRHNGIPAEPARTSSARQDPA
jgi:Fe-S-cluster containining protein